MRKQRRYFQWIDGENKGEVETLETIEDFEGEIIYNFVGGESCNQRYISKMTESVTDLKRKFMVEIESPSNPWLFETIKPKKYVDESMKGEDIDIPSLHDILQARGESSNVTDSDIGKDKLVPPRNKQRLIDLPNISEFAPEKKPQVQTEVKQTQTIDHSPNVVEQTQTVPVEQIQEPPVQQVIYQPVAQPQVQQPIMMDPVRILVNTCKKHDTPVEMTVNMKLPSRYIANIATSEFEDGFEKFIDCIVSDIDLNMIIDELREALRNAYQEDQQEEN